ncbi:TonB-dependent receptor [Ancylomarina sp. DW003]|nr:TonB-dependent receptor [Ancylomarina sp. DW003]MDE5423898.1 TonB-dependent receptor [Ancylomarina sp. DW003]
MEKFELFRYSKLFGIRTKWLIAMKTFILLFFAFSIQLNASVLSQQRVSMKMSNVSAKELIKEIESQTNLGFIYNLTEIEKLDGLFIDADQQTVEEVLDEVLEGTDLTYEIDKSVIIIIPKPEEPKVKVQQEKRELKGTVTDEDGNSLPGVSVVVKGTITGVATDIDGNYSILIEGNKAVLVFSFVGMIPQEVAYSGQQVIDIKLQADSEGLDEVMVVAYGTAKRSSFTGAAAVVDNERLQEAQVSNISNAMQGVSSGVQVISSTGQPGSSATIRIRGVGSLSGNSSPLYVVDGVPYDGDLNSINPSDIKSMTVLKDAASASIYGSRAANGVIVITTKKGEKNKKAEISIKSTLGISSRAVAPIDRVNTNDWMELCWEAMRNGYIDNGIETDLGLAGKRASKELISKIGINPYGTANPEPVGVDGKIKDGLNPLWDNDWDEEIIGTGVRSETNVNVSGGSEKTQYYFSGGYLDDQGMMLRSGFRRTSVRMSLNNQTTDWLKLNLNMNYVNSKTKHNDSQDSNIGNGATYGLSLANFYPIYQRDRETGAFVLDNEGNKKYDYGLYRTNSFKRSNLIDHLPRTINETKIDLITLRGSAEIDFGKINTKFSALKGLKFKTSYNADIRSSNTHDYSFGVTADGSDPNGYDVIPNLQSVSASRSTGTRRNFTFNNILTYDKELAEAHSISVLLGQELYEYSYVYSGGSKDNFPLPNITEPTFGSNISDFDAYSDLYRLNSYFGRFEYGYDGKYNASFSYRFDGSSRFHEDNRWGQFWSVGASWNVTKENFMKNNNTFDILRLRSSYGSSGNQNINTYYAYQNMYASTNLGGSPGIYPTRIGNKDLQWEGNISTNIGLDYGLFGVVRGNVEWFQRVSDNLIYSQPLPTTSGFSNILTNVGKLRNRGFEFEIRASLIDKEDFKWELGINGTHYKNELVEYPVEEGTISGTKRYKAGSDIYEFFIRDWAGNTKGGETTYIRQNDGSIAESTSKAQGGQASWYIVDEQDGTKYQTTDYNSADRIEAGSALPDLYGGISTEVRIHNFTVSALLSYSLGGKFYTGGDYTRRFGYSNSESVSPWAKQMKNRWTPDNPESDLPRLTSASLSNSWSSTSTRHLYDASYARLKNISITYNFPETIISKLGISDASVFIQGENLITIFGLDGVDPETGGLSGVSGYRYPVSRVFSGGFSLKF